MMGTGDCNGILAGSEKGPARVSAHSPGCEWVENVKGDLAEAERLFKTVYLQTQRGRRWENFARCLNAGR